MRELEHNAPHKPDPVEPHMLYSPDGGATWEYIPLRCAEPRDVEAERSANPGNPTKEEAV